MWHSADGAMDQYHVNQPDPPASPGRVRKELDDLLVRLQTADAARAVDALIDAGAAELGEVAVQAARQEGP